MQVCNTQIYTCVLSLHYLILYLEVLASHLFYVSSCHLRSEFSQIEPIITLFPNWFPFPSNLSLLVASMYPGLKCIFFYPLFYLLPIKQVTIFQSSFSAMGVVPTFFFMVIHTSLPRPSNASDGSPHPSPGLHCAPPTDLV